MPSSALIFDSTLLAGIAGSPVAAAITQPDDARLTARRETWALPGGRMMSGFIARAPIKLQDHGDPVRCHGATVLPASRSS